MKNELIHRRVNMKKLLNVFAFFKSTLAVSIAVSLFPLFLGGLSSFIAVFLTFGFVVSIAVKEIYNKNHYFFYFNNGLSKMQLRVFSYLMNVIFALLLASALILLRHLF